MTATNNGSIAIAVINRIHTSLGSDVLADMSEDNATYINAMTGETGLQDKFVPAIIALTCADAIRKEVGDSDISLADFSFGGGNASKVIDQFESKANNIIKKHVTRSIPWEKVNG